jgi:hypothetical protein
MESHALCRTASLHTLSCNLVLYIQSHVASLQIFQKSKLWILPGGLSLSVLNTSFKR